MAEATSSFVHENSGLNDCKLQSYSERVDGAVPPTDKSRCARVG
jgi:hypothetical protein